MQTSTQTDTKKMKAEAKSLDQVAESLRLVLADTFVLYMKTYAIHWNYQGDKFFSVHKMTEEHYEELAEAIDEIAERIRALGKAAPISLSTILASSDLQELERNMAGTDDKSLIDLISSHTLLSKRAHESAEICETMGDLYSHDLMVSRIGNHDKAVWMLQSFLEGKRDSPSSQAQSPMN